VVLCIKRPSQNSKLRSSSKVVNLVWRTPKIQHSFKEQHGRENQPKMKPAMLALRATPQGEEYFELNREFPGSLPATKNHQGGLFWYRRWVGHENTCCARIFQMTGKTINYLSRLSPKLDCLFQCQQEARWFKPGKDKVWYCNLPLGVNIPDLMLKLWSSPAGIPISRIIASEQLQWPSSLTTVRRGTLNQSPATNPTIQSKTTTIDLPLTSKGCLKPLQLPQRTQQNGSWLQAHPPRQFKHPQHPFLSSIIKRRFPTTWETPHTASKCCITFLLSLIFTTAPMCKFTIILAVKAG